MKVARGLVCASVLSSLLFPPSAWAVRFIGWGGAGGTPTWRERAEAGVEYVQNPAAGTQYLTLPATWTLEVTPAGAAPGALIDANGLITGWTPSCQEIGTWVHFKVEVFDSSTPPDNHATAEWDVKVLAGQPWNNGFNANHIFAIKGVDPVTGAQEGKIYKYDESGTVLQEYTNWEKWVSLTISGDGAHTNDAWCYTVRGWSGSSGTGGVGSPYNGLNIRRFASDGSVNPQNWVHELPGGWQTATNLQPGSIRYSSIRGSVFVGADRNQASTADAALAYEIDLNLSQIKAVYTGPINGGGQVNLAVSPRDGALYMVSQQLGTANGDLVRFDTSGGSTSTYTTLVNGSTMYSAHPEWNLPNCVIYRMGATQADDTLVVCMDSLNVIELYASTGVWKGTLPSINRGWNGQQSGFNGSIVYAAMADGFGQLSPLNSLKEFNNGDAQWRDAASAPFPASTSLMPSIGGVPPNPDAHLAQIEYVRQLTLAQGAPATWSLVGPAGAVIDQTGRISGWIPNSAYAGSTVGFTATVVNSNSVCDTVSASWFVNVMDSITGTNNGFQVGQIYAIHNVTNPLSSSYPMMGQIQSYSEVDGSLPHPLYSFGTGIEGYTGLTFSGTGTTGARLFGLRRWNTNAPTGLWHQQPPYNGFNIREFKSDGNDARDQRFLVVGIGTNVLTGNIRYSTYSNHLYVGVNRNQNGTEAMRVYEFSVGASQGSALAQTDFYLGPASAGGPVNVEPNPHNGTLYMVGPRLGDNGGPLGDLVAFDTITKPKPVTIVINGIGRHHTTLVDGQTFAAAHPEWNLPNCVIYRQNADPADPNRSADDTLVVFMDTGSVAVELWADTTAHPKDANGNLQFRRLIAGVNRGWNGQQDLATHDVHFAAMADGFGTLTVRDTLVKFLPDDPDWADAASPPFPFVPPLCNKPFADVDYDGDVDQADFAVFQLCLTDPYYGTIPTDPSVCICFDRTGTDPGNLPDGKIDAFDVALFEQCATGPGIHWIASCDD